VLSDPDRRRAYDASLAAVDPEPVPAAPDALGASAPLPADELDEIDEEQGEFDGSRLRRCRLQREMELEEVAGVTKVNPAYLAFIEEERFDALPAPVYVRGFVAAFASCLGLDGSRVARSYMQRYESQRPQPPRRRRGRS
jgi:flagellar biosynthesis protein FlhG